MTIIGWFTWTSLVASAVGPYLAMTVGWSPRSRGGRGHVGLGAGERVRDER